MKERWGMHFNDAVVILKSNETNLAKKICRFLDYFFFYRSLKLVHLHLQLLGLHGCEKIIGCDKYLLQT